MEMLQDNRSYIILRILGLLTFFLLIIYIFLNLQTKSIIKIEELEVKRLKILDTNKNVRILIDTDNKGNPKMYFLMRKET